jgi:hypothetical protein
MPNAALTIASRRYVANARVTAKSFVAHNPGIAFYLLLADEDGGALDAAQEPFRVVRLDELALPEPQRFRFQYAELPFSYALTPFAIEHLLGRGHERVLFLKQETLVLGELGSIWSGLERHSALVTPHFLRPPRRADALEWELNVLRAGVFNGGVIAFADCAETRAFLAWWKERTFRGCVLDPANGFHYEQRWLDFLPSLMPGYGQVRDPGVNVGHWNLPDREIRVAGDKVTAEGAPCRVFRFSGYDPDAPAQVTRYNAHYRVDSTGDAAKVFALYQSMLGDAGQATAREQPYAYDHFDNGTPITEDHRRKYRRLGKRAGGFGDPFQSAPAGSFYRWLQTSAQGGPA